MQKIAHTNLKVYSTEERRRDEIMNTIADISSAKSELKWQPEWTLEKGLTEIIKEQFNKN